MRMKRQLIKQIVPPILARLYASSAIKVKGVRRRDYNWEGIYERYADVPVRGSGHNSDDWVNATLEYTMNVIQASQIHSTIPKEVAGDNAFLPMLASIVCQKRGAVKVLDFGGGMGIAYIHLMHSALGSPRVEYHIVEAENICRAGPLLFSGDRKVQFHKSLPDVSDVDIVYMSSVLQYIEDYTDLLRSLCAYQSRYFLFSKLSAGDIPTYASAQMNLPGSVIPYWFININELINIMAQGGYSLIFRASSERQYNQDNFPVKYRMGTTCNLLFTRSDSCKENAYSEQSR